VNQPTAQRSSRVFCVLGVAILLLAAFPGKAANLVDVRVGVHQEYTRIVLETDARAPCQIESSGSEELVLRLDASSGARVVTSKQSAHLVSISVMPAEVGVSEIRIALRGPVETEKLVLSAPDRIVLDLRKAEGAGAVPPTEEQPAPPIPLPEPVAEAIPEPAAATPAPMPDSVTEAPLEPAPEEIEDAVAAPALPEPDPGSLLAAEEVEEPVPVAPQPSTLSPHAAVPPLPGAEPGFLDALPEPFDQPLLLAGLVVALILALALVVLRRRGAAKDERATTPFAAGEPFSVDEEPGVAKQGGEAAFPAEASPESSLFDQPAEPAEPPDEQRDATPATDGEEIAAAPPVGEPAPGPGSGQELEGRFAQLEERLNEIGDTTDRLGRQIAAQTEELRVQRAAIARTQRVLRDLTRPTDEATEPVPKT
jgi:hypothetical protein